MTPLNVWRERLNHMPEPRWHKTQRDNKQIAITGLTVLRYCKVFFIAVPRFLCLV